MDSGFPKITPIKIGSFSLSFKTLGKIKGFDDIPCFAFLIEDKGISPILVDTGFSPLYIPGSNSEFNQTDTLEESINELGYRVDDIENIILTHLHWDHTGGLPLFKNAKIYLNKDELLGLLYLKPNEETYFIPDFFIDSFEKFELTGDAVSLSRNIEIVKTGFHTHGHQVVKVKCREKTIVLTGDAPFDYSWLWKRIPPAAWDEYKKGSGAKFYWEKGTRTKIKTFLMEKNIEIKNPGNMNPPVFEESESLMTSHDFNL